MVVSLLFILCGTVRMYQRRHGVAGCGGSARGGVLQHVEAKVDVIRQPSTGTRVFVSRGSVVVGCVPGRRVQDKRQSQRGIASLVS